MNADTLLPIIDLYIEKKRDIVFDMFRSYIKVSTRRFNHLQPIIPFNFVNPKNGNRTQLIENLWMLRNEKFIKIFELKELIYSVISFNMNEKKLKKKLFRI
ncbi:hypothetical protein DMUE_3503 [Dictyocoela muelleri]|nr:hypothetical protein DMUE_3503 [Dictyocoela muelleri]